MSKRILRRVAATAVTGLLLVPMLASCAALDVIQASVDARNSSEIESPAQIQNSQLAAETELLLAQLWEGEGDLPVGGNVRRACQADEGGEAYLFYGSWFSPASAAVSPDRSEAIMTITEMSDWLEAQGWEYVETFEFTTEKLDVNAVGVGASKSAAGIPDMQVIYYFEGQLGQPEPHIVVDIDSDCLVADL
ncbi:hypothetical protein QBL02_08110 [Leucobacter sp. UT-8R-CII-1-4]|uniref:hypothetical protein n=1 Tax=Leucobacter sp. UT-8R-CII-1-4 TaxID=3040075 RepID=UPI0024A8E238|nr:hypothetical protein [Leucobacter sp. UT-8R-CII-1-4]MDI6023506.1 hypothetical protein [Leucobacter sp. UT-8R-CII-1-4]